jgi:hypothetical protein
VTPEPGIYEGVPFAEYREWEAMNASTLVYGLQSMRHLHAALHGLMGKDSPALRFGRAMHSRLLEPDLYAAEWPVAGPCSQFVGSGRRKNKPCGRPGRYASPDGHLWVCGQHKLDGYAEPADYVTAEEHARIERIRRHAMEHAEIRHLRRFPGSETSLVFDLLGVRCKARLDKLVRTDAGAVIVDLKKVAAGRLTERAWQRSVRDYAYHFKAAFYLDGLKALTGDEATFSWVVLEDGEPFDVALFYADPFTLDAGRQDYVRVLDGFKRATESGVWPGAFPEPIECGLSQFDLREYAGQGVAT